MNPWCARLVAMLAALGAACGAEGTGEGVGTPERGELTATYGEIVLTYSQELSDREGEGAAPFSIVARFARGSDADRLAVRNLLGENLPDPPVDREDCTPITSGVGRVGPSLTGSLDLLDAGDLVVTIDGEDVRIPDWSFPSVYGMISGVLYGGDDALGLPFRPGREYRISSTGSGQVGAVDVQLVAPDELSGLSLDGVEAGIEPLVVDGGGPLEVRWEPDPSATEVLVELSWTSFATEQRVVCRSRDDGEAELPAAAAARIADPGATDARLTVHRVSRVSLAADGLDEGEAYFVVVAAVPLR